MLYPPLKVSTSTFASSCNGSDVGKKIANIFVSNDSLTDMTPEIIKLQSYDIGSTTAKV